MKKIDVKFVLKGLTYVGLITMIIIMMMIASSCSTEPKPEMSQEEAANLTDSIREEISGQMFIQYDYTINAMTIVNMENAAAADNFLTDKIGSYILLTGLDEMYLGYGIEDAGFTMTYYTDGSTFTMNTDLGFIDVVENGYTSLYGYLAKEKNVDSSYILVGCFPATANGSVDTAFFGIDEETTPVGETTNNSDHMVEETEAAVDPELTDPSTRPSDLSKCFIIDMYAQSETDTMTLLEDHLGEWVHLYNLNTTSPESGTTIMYAYVGTENIGGGNANLQIAGEGGYLNLALADGLTDEFYGFVGIDGMTQEIYIGNIFAANEDTLCSDPTGPDGEPPSDWGGSEPSSTIYVDEDISVNAVRFAAQHAGERIIYEGTVNSIYENYVLLDWEYYVYFSDPTQIWNFNEDDIIRIEGGICVDGFGLVNFSDATLIAVIN